MNQDVFLKKKEKLWIIVQMVYIKKVRKYEVPMFLLI